MKLGRRSQDTGMRILFQGISEPISVAGSGAKKIQAHLDLIQPIWPKCIKTRPSRQVPHISVSVQSGKYLITDDVGKHQFYTTNSWHAAFRISSILNSRLISQRAGQLGLHSAGVRVGSDMVLLVGPHGLGKTSIVTFLAMAGDHVLCDDDAILRCAETPLPKVVTVGSAMNVRTPLPAEFPSDVKEFIKDMCTTWDASWPQGEQSIALVDLHQEEGGSFLEEHAVTALVFLERTDGLPCKLSNISSSEALAGLLQNVLGDEFPDGNLVRELSSFVTRVPAYRLGFASSDEAALSIRSKFGQ